MGLVKQVHMLTRRNRASMERLVGIGNEIRPKESPRSDEKAKMKHNPHEV